MPYSLRLALLVAALCACEPRDKWPPPAVYDPHPEPPSILRDVALIDDDATDGDDDDDDSGGRGSAVDCTCGSSSRTSPAEHGEPPEALAGSMP